MKTESLSSHTDVKSIVLLRLCTFNCTLNCRNQAVELISAHSGQLQHRALAAELTRPSSLKSEPGPRRRDTCTHEDNSGKLKSCLGEFVGVRMHRCVILQFTSDFGALPALKTQRNVPNTFLHVFAKGFCPPVYLDTERFRQTNKQVCSNKMPERWVLRQEFYFFGLEPAT